MALAESDAPETVRFGAGGDSMRSHPSRGSSPNGGIEEGRGKVARRGGAIWVTPCRVRGCPRAVPRSGMRLARALPGRGHCWGPRGEDNGVGGMQNKLLAGLSVQGGCRRAVAYAECVFGVGLGVPVGKLSL